MTVRELMEKFQGMNKDFDLDSDVIPHPSKPGVLLIEQKEPIFGRQWYQVFEIPLGEGI